jgi:hypothetical protein
VEESNPRVRHGFVLLTKIQDLNPADGFPPQPMWFDAAQVVSVARSTWEPDPERYKDWIRSWSDVVLTPPNQPFRVTETAEEVIDLVAEARDRFMPFERPLSEAILLDPTLLKAGEGWIAEDWRRITDWNRITVLQNAMGFELWLKRVEDIARQLRK